MYTYIYIYIYKCRGLTLGGNPNAPCGLTLTPPGWLPQTRPIFAQPPPPE